MASFALLVVFGQGCTHCTAGNGTKGSDCKSSSDCNDPLSCCQTEYCTDLQTDNQNCGRCDNGCPDQTYCNNGECLCGLMKCPGAQHCCGNACVPWDEAHCGNCGITCPAGAQCCAGSDGTLGCTAPNDRLNCGGCGSTCLPEDECCGGQCADNNDNCGKCGRACPAGEVCVETTPGHDCFPVDAGTDAAVDAGDAGDPCANVTCSGKTCCALGGIPDCVDLNTDRLNCGFCNNPCVGGDVCVAGKCVPADAAADADGALCLQPGIFCGDAGSGCCSGTCGGPGDTQGVCCDAPKAACTPGVTSAGSCCQTVVQGAGGVPQGTGRWCVGGDAGPPSCCVVSANQQGPVCAGASDCCDPFMSCTMTVYGPQCCQGGSQPCRGDADCCTTGPGSSHGHCNPNPTGTGNICCAAKDQDCDNASTCCGSLKCSRVGNVYLCE